VSMRLPRAAVARAPNGARIVSVERMSGFYQTIWMMDARSTGSRWKSRKRHHMITLELRHGEPRWRLRRRGVPSGSERRLAERTRSPDSRRDLPCWCYAYSPHRRVADWRMLDARRFPAPRARNLVLAVRRYGSVTRLSWAMMGTPRVRRSGELRHAACRSVSSEAHSTR
jgi:hypothetical protein